ncbi:LysR family transcriptional regulator [Pseudoprimorskyibacter insulae]|uniref:Transcriptional activator protein NhaR n=1 Tax=Pseudoprimorskyibacter insulae TaxID=1695997 RepID=A0A2R8AN77_9RHOB|nr:LysR family transcriptional regulator [Pseudoprimorskyibacter insulae]SPF77470.1 Transcriptional activator protein NhaR [Pseudoprimorskyibacter insulae]
MDNWDEVRTAFHVARAGTVSGAADALGVHHATVIRHVDALEARLGVKLFQRHARGYAPTEAGVDLLRVAESADSQFQQLAGRLRGQGAGVSGELIVTSLVHVSHMMVPMIARFQEAHPDVVIRYITDERLFRLEYGEAHVAIRAGVTPPQNPDNVVQPLMEDPAALYASAAYIDKYGRPETEVQLAEHRFVAHDNTGSRAPTEQWLRANVPPDRVVFRSGDPRIMAMAVESGVGLGFMSVAMGDASPDLMQVMPPRDDWTATLWLVTHVDLHRTAKVQAFLSHLKAEVKALPCMKKG